MAEAKQAEAPIRYQLLDESIKLDSAVDILVDAFTTRTEPACYSLSSRSFRVFAAHYLKDAARDKLSVVATVNDKVVGVCFNNDLAEPEADGFLEQMQALDYYGYSILFQILDDLDVKLVDEMTKKQLMSKGNVFHVYMIAVDGQFGQRGIGKQLLRESVDIAKQRGFKYAMAEVTNDYSMKAFKKSGFEVYDTISYPDWQYPAESGVCPYKGIAKITGFNTLYSMTLELQSQEAAAEPEAAKTDVQAEQEDDPATEPEAQQDKDKGAPVEE